MSALPQRLLETTNINQGTKLNLQNTIDLGNITGTLLPMKSLTIYTLYTPYIQYIDPGKFQQVNAQNTLYSAKSKRCLCAAVSAAHA